MWGQRRRDKLRAGPFPEGWKRILDAGVPFYKWLPEADRGELEGHIQVFLAEKSFEGCDGLAITDEIRVCVAASACLLLLHRDADYFPSLRSVVVFPSTYYVDVNRHMGAGVRWEYRGARLGQASPSGAVVLAWDAVRSASPASKLTLNIVIHEFAHFLDFENGYQDGAPLLTFRESGAMRKNRLETWKAVWSGEFEKHRARVQVGEDVTLDPYGAQNPVEFFAVATESFFVCPHEVREHHQELYEQLKSFFMQDPICWVPKSEKLGVIRRLLTRAAAKSAKGDLAGAIVDYTQAIEKEPGCSVLFKYRGDIKLRQKAVGEALLDYNKAVELEPSSASAYCGRGLAKRELADLEGALADYSKAISLNPNHSKAYHARGLAKQAKGDFEGAVADYTKAIDQHSTNSPPYFSRGYVHYLQGRLPEALRDFQSGHNLNPDSGNAVIWLVRARLGEQKAATNELREYLENLDPEEAKDWKFQIARFLADQLTEAELFQAAEYADLKQSARRLCAAYFYTGYRHLLDRNLPFASDLFKKCVATGETTIPEHRLAVEELKLLRVMLEDRHAM